MAMRCLLQLLAGIVVSACVSNPAASDLDCKRYAFERGAPVYIRTSFVGEVDGRLEFLAPRDLFRLTIEVPESDISKLPRGYVISALSAYFRHVGPDQVECFDADKNKMIRCYKQVSINSSKPMQIVVELDSTKIKFSEAIDSTNKVIEYLERTAFSCGGTTRR